MNPRTALAWLSFLALGCGGGDDEATSSDGGAGGTPSAAGSGGAGGAGGAAGSGGAASSGGGLPGGAGGTMDAGAMGGAGGAPFVDVLVPPPDYSEAASWLCLPGAPNDVCAEELDATVVAADGTTTTEVHTPAADPAIDCFYVYPTISLDMSGNSDLEAGKEEVDIVQQQAARLTSVCRMYAPLYRQVTVASLFGTITPKRTRDEMRETAYADVLAAFTHYLENDNNGRGFVLIGHSQGAGLLRRVVQEEIDDDASIRDRMVAAYIVGSAVAVPDGADVGGDFQNIAACRSESQTGCVVSYATYAETAPPPDDSLFGAPRDAAGVALCVNPAAPAGGAAPLSPYWKTDGGLLDVSALDTTEPYVTFPGLLEGQCVRRNGFDVLEVTVNADPSDPRPDELDGRLAPNWGLHLIDLHLTMGDVVDLVQSQAAAYAAP